MNSPAFDRALESAFLLWEDCDIETDAAERLKAKLRLLESLARDPHNINGAAFRVAYRLVMKHYNFRYGYAFPSVAALAKDLRLSERTIERAVSALKKDPEQRIIVKSGGGPKKKRRANEYAIDWNRWIKEPEQPVPTELSPTPDNIDGDPRQNCRRPPTEVSDQSLYRIPLSNPSIESGPHFTPEGENEAPIEVSRKEEIEEPEGPNTEAADKSEGLGNGKSLKARAAPKTETPEQAVDFVQKKLEAAGLDRVTAWGLLIDMEQAEIARLAAADLPAVEMLGEVRREFSRAEALKC